MNCQQCQPLLGDFALDLLGQDEAAQVRAHVATLCPVCRDELTAIRQALDVFATSIDPVPPPPSVKEQLLSRVRDSKLTRATPTPTSNPRWWLYGATTVAATLAGLLASQWWTPAGDPTTGAATFEQQLAVDRRALGSGDTRYALLDTAGPQQRAAGYVVWDGLAQQIHLVTFDLPKLGSRELACVWLATSADDWHYAGPLAIANGHGTAVVDLPPDATRFKRLVVTRELVVGDPPAEPHGDSLFESSFD